MRTRAHVRLALTGVIPTIEMEKSHSIVRPDGLTLHAVSWSAGRAPARRVFLGHSHVVHSGWMRPLGRAFAEAGWQAFAGDIRGHGRSTNRANPIMHLDGARGWRLAVDDFLALTDLAFEDVPFEKRLLVLPNILSLIALCALEQRPDLAACIVLVAPPPNQPLLARLGSGFAAARARFRPPATPDEQFLHHIYTYLGSHLRERRHLLDVVSPDASLIQQILDDPLSWNVPTTAYWQAVFHGMAAAWSWPRRFRLHPGTRFLILYGEDDPMTRDGAFCGAMADHLRHHGAQEVTARGVAGARSGLFLEEERLGIAARIRAWVEGDAGDGTPPETPPPARMVDDFARAHFGEVVAPGQPVLTPEAFVSLAYAGIEDETRWVEIMTRILLMLSEAPAHDLEHFLTEMMPHWDRAFGLQQQLRTQAALGEVWAQTLERIGVACALVDRSGKVLHHNSRFAPTLAALLAAGGAEVAGGLDGQSRALLADPLRRGLTPAGPGALVMWQGEPVGVVMRPPALDTHARQLGNPVGLVVLRGAAGEADAAGLLSVAYGLTPTEAQVALGVMRGEAPAVIARALGVSINTVRTHLAQAYAKTGSAGKAELAARLHASPLGLIGGSHPNG